MNLRPAWDERFYLDLDTEDFWSNVDTDPSVGILDRAFRPDVTWSDTRSGCIAQMGNGLKCTRPASRDWPFCHRQHSERAAQAVLNLIAKRLREAPYPGQALAKFYETLLEDFDRPNRARWALIHNLMPVRDHHRPTARVRSSSTTDRTALYRHYDADGVLLYVGITRDLEARFRSHSKHAAWVQYAATHTGEWFDSRAEAERAEAQAIRDELPVFNKVLNYGGAGRVDAYLIARRHPRLDESA